MAIGVAIIGSGIFATEYHLPAVQETPILSLKAIYSRSSASASALAAKADNVSAYSDDGGAGNTYSDLLARADIAAVIIALPILSQPAFIEAALAAGKHVLSEKPIANDLAAAEKLIASYKAGREKGGQATWGVAENFRFMQTFRFAREKIEGLGRVLGFRVKVFTYVKAGSKYFETEWRKTPSHQGGFILDGGVHFTAGTRLLLGATNRPTSLSAYTALLQPHLPPVDTVNSVWQTASGVSGTVQISFGTSLRGDKFTVGCEEGAVCVSRDTVTVRTGEGEDAKSESWVFKDEKSGVVAEVKAWAEGLESGVENKEQSPEMALADLELLEGMLRSGEGDGVKVVLERQL